MTDMVAASKAYVFHVMDLLEITATTLANEAGIAPTTLTRPLFDPSHRYCLSLSTISKIAAFSGISPGQFFYAFEQGLVEPRPVNGNGFGPAKKQATSKAHRVPKSGRSLPDVGVQGIEVDGVRLSISGWARKLEISRNAIYHRMLKRGERAEIAIRHFVLRSKNSPAGSS